VQDLIRLEICVWQITAGMDLRVGSKEEYEIFDLKE
jgi:hypothetical protein